MALARNVSARQAGAYYEKDDYYTSGRSPSEWHGHAARALGLSGPVDRDRFRQLIDGEISDGSVLHRGGGARRGGTDFEFSAPKSFSIQALVFADERLLELHRHAVATARERIEETVATRVTENRQTRVEKTNSALIAQFEHYTSRAGDPDLHSHVVVINATQRADGQWRSVENAEMFREQRLMYQIYLSELAVGASKLGYTLAEGKHGNPELAHITREQIEHFSGRAKDVEVALAAGGLNRANSSAAQKRVAALATRDAKKEYDQSALQAEWVARATAVGVSSPKLNLEQAVRLTSEFKIESAGRAIAFSIDHLSEREAAFERNALYVEALKASRGVTGYAELKSALRESIDKGHVLQDTTRSLFTTPKAIEIERSILAAESLNRGTVTPILDLAAFRHSSQLTSLNEGQRAAAELILRTSNRVVGVNGLAGTGKTTTLTAARALLEEQGYTVAGLAPSHSAVRALNQAGVTAQTVQSWLLAHASKNTLSDRTVLIVDEAGLMGSAMLRSVLERANESASRVVLVGDIHQYESVEAGRAFAQLQRHGMATAQLTEMVRQRNLQLAASAKLAVNNPSAALSMLPVIENANADQRYDQIAKHYASLTELQRSDTLVLTGTHVARTEINTRIREALGLSGSGQAVEVFRSVDLSAAQKKLATQYQAGAAVRFERSYRSLGVTRGQIATVERVVGSAVVLKLADESKRAMHPARLSGKGWSLGAIDRLELSHGDQIRFTGTNPQEGYKNGERALVDGITEGHALVRREDGAHVRISLAQPLSVDYSYVVTGHSAQGLDAKQIILDKDSHSRTTDHRSFYTDLTRAKDSALIFTNDSASLHKAVSVDRSKTTAEQVAPVRPSRSIEMDHEFNS